jgi:hypothetical protein
MINIFWNDFRINLKSVMKSSFIKKIREGSIAEYERGSSERNIRQCCRFYLTCSELSIKSINVFVVTNWVEDLENPLRQIRQLSYKFLENWEQMHNSDFNSPEFSIIKHLEFEVFNYLCSYRMEA